MEALSIVVIFLQTVILFYNLNNHVVVARLDIGVCYGMKGDNLLPSKDVIDLYKKYNIAKIRLFDPNHDALQALRGSDLEVTLGTLNEDIPSLGSNYAFAQTWFNKYVAPYKMDVNFAYISVGNEVPDNLASSIAPAMINIRKVLDDNHLNAVKVTTTLSTQVLQNTYPPSSAEFTPAAKHTMVEILQFLATQKAPVLMVNVYPYFAYASEPSHIRLDYTLFEATKPVVSDGAFIYYSLFDAIVDGVYWAMEKVNAPQVAVAVSESGWPSAGNGNMTTPDIAQRYNKNFMTHILMNKGTPKRPNVHLDGFIFAMFNEDLKSPEIERNFGLFYNNGKPVYPIFS